MAGKKTMEALQLHGKGFNCAQAVALPFCEELGMDKSTAMRALEGFGSGMGNMQHTCGALSAAVFVAGLLSADGNICGAPASKQKTYALCREIEEEFRRECGAETCTELKGLTTGKPLKSCRECVMAAASILERHIKK